MPDGTYQQWGFRQSPFLTLALPASAEGKELLVGRDDELRQLGRRLPQGGKVITVEGPNGVGKTSVINVAVYSAFDHYLREGTGTLLIPCRETFQLSFEENPDRFRRKVVFGVAQTLIEKADEVRQLGFGSGMPVPLNRWLNSPTITNISIGLSVMNIGGSGQVETAVNTSVGFSESGFERTVIDWLRELFPANEGGGVVCVLDNLELLRESANARHLLEQMRDDVFGMSGIRWVFAGAMGIVRTVAATPRLRGYLHGPIDISGLPTEAAPDVLERRIKAFSNKDWYLPITAADFSSLYTVLNGIMRDALSMADEYCQWIADHIEYPEDETAKHKDFNDWFAFECDKCLRACDGILTKRAWVLFDEIVKLGGSCAPGAFEDLGFGTRPAMASQTRKLEEARLVISVREEEDNRRKTILLTSSGWIVSHARRHALPKQFDPKVAPEEAPDGDN